jgi:hypothetical protein
VISESNQLIVWIILNYLLCLFCHILKFDLLCYVTYREVLCDKKIALHSCNHFRHGWDMYDISDIFDKWAPRNSVKFSGTRPIVSGTQPILPHTLSIVPDTQLIIAGTRPVVVCTRSVVAGTRSVIAGTDPGFIGFIDLVPLGWIHRHSANYSR